MYLDIIKCMLFVFTLVLFCSGEISPVGKRSLANAASTTTPIPASGSELESCSGFYVVELEPLENSLFEISACLSELESKSISQKTAVETIEVILSRTSKKVNNVSELHDVVSYIMNNMCSFEVYESNDLSSIGEKIASFLKAQKLLGERSEITRRTLLNVIDTYSLSEDCLNLFKVRD